MKILDRYISVSVAAAFLSGVTMFMVLLCAMSLLKELIELIAQQGVPVGMALLIFAYKIPGMLVYAFPMAVLLGILLTFSRMSAESEMVAMRAAGISFVRIVTPTLFIAIIVTGFTFWISNSYAPYASKKSIQLAEEALNKIRRAETVNFSHKEEDEVKYTITASDLQLQNKGEAVMRAVTIVNYTERMPTRVYYIESAQWDPAKGQWKWIGEGFSVPLGAHAIEPSVYAGHNTKLTVSATGLVVKESPFQLSSGKKDPTELTSEEIQRYISDLRHSKDSNEELGKWTTRLAQRFATPFTCLVFALIGAALGLRHHRTSSAVGLGISLLVIFVYYFISVYLSTFGDSGTLPPLVAAWTPNVLGLALGIGLIYKANQ